MDGQITVFNYMKPDYLGSQDEIVRYSIENRFTLMIPLQKCCGRDPEECFKSSHEYFVRCPICKSHTDCYRHLYEAKQAWNLGRMEGI